jgi:hypothetical protein
VNAMPVQEGCSEHAVGMHDSACILIQCDCSVHRCLVGMLYVEVMSLNTYCCRTQLYTSAVLSCCKSAHRMLSMCGVFGVALFADSSMHQSIEEVAAGAERHES